MESMECKTCGTHYPRPALDKDLICYECEPPFEQRGMKIAIAGRMASGKTTLAQELVKDFQRNGQDASIVSLAGKVKEIATDLFGMTEKNRPLLQQIGMKMREIEPDVWLDYVIHLADKEQAKGNIVIVDDVRFVNEAEKLNEKGWKVIKITVNEETQMERLKKTYSDWEIHWENRDNPSEKEVDMIDLSIITCHIGAEDTLNFETEWLK